MRITAVEFDQRLADNNLRIALIGMSNIGKSYTAARIVKADGFKCYDVDAQIQNAMGNPSMDKMAKWMGHPYSDGYAEKSTEYLALETELSLAANERGGNLVLDTTGSVIHIYDAAKNHLNNNYLIIYIKARQSDIETLIDRYFKFPKPTIWGDSFKKLPNKSNAESLLACYPNLLNARAAEYAELCDIEIDAGALASPSLNDKDILPFIRSAL